MHVLDAAVATASLLYSRVHSRDRLGKIDIA